MLYGVDKPGRVSDDEIFAALRQAAMYDTLMTRKSRGDGRRLFPLGIMTVLKDRGGKPFSVGQAQRRLRASHKL